MEQSLGPGLFAYARRLNTQEVFVVFNTTNSSQVLASRPTIYAAGTTLVNLFDTNETATVTATADTADHRARHDRQNVHRAIAWLPLDPVVTSISPAHDSTIFPSLTPLAVQFSQPMDTNSVMAAFSDRSRRPAAALPGRRRAILSPTRRHPHGRD